MPSSDRIALFFCSPEEAERVRASVASDPVAVHVFAADESARAADRFDFAILGTAATRDRAVLIAFLAELRVPATVLLASEDDTPHLADNPGTLLVADLHRLPYIIRRETQLHRTQAALRETQRQYRRLLDQVQDGVWVVDTAGRTIFANQKMADMLRSSSEALQRMAIYDAVDEEMRAVAIRNLHPRHGGAAEAHDFLFRRGDGTTFWGALSTSELSDEVGQHIGTLAVISDISSRKEMDANLRRRETQLSIAQQLAKLGSWELEVATGVLTVSDELLHHFGQPAGWTAKHIDELFAVVHPDDVAGLRAAIATSAEHGTPFECEYRVMRSDGSIVCFESRAQVVVDEAGRAVRLIGMSQDVTERKQNLRALRHSEERLRNLVASVPDATWMATHKVLYYMSPNIVDITGFTAEEILAGGHDTWAARVHPDDHDRIYAAYDAMFVRNAEYEVEYRFRRRDGEWIWLMERAEVKTEDGAPFAFGTMSDITARKRATEALRQSETRYRVIVEQASDIIYSVDREGRITSLNAAFQSITGWDAAEWIGRPFGELIDADSLARATDHFHSILGGGDRTIAEYDVRCSDGTLITVETSPQALVTEDGVAGTIGIARDVTHRKAAAAEADREKRLVSLGQLAASVAHEFNNVLMSILPFAELIKRRVPSDDRIDLATKHIFQAIRRGREISKEVLRFSRPNSAKLAPVRLRGWLDAFAAEARATLGPKWTLVTRAHVGGDPVIKADRSLLDTVAMNLLLNSRDAMSQGGEIVIELRRLDKTRQIAIDVHDRGVGISEELIDRIFEPLFTTKQSGSGLGLTIAYQAMLLQHGLLRVSSRPGEGSTFSMIFNETAQPAELAPARRRVLVVEDDDTVAEGLRSLLVDEGYEVQLVPLGLDAPGAIESFDPHVVLLDVNLPDISGLTLHEDLRERWPELPIIFSTGSSDSKELEFVRQREVPAIVKPFEIGELIEVMERTFARAS